MKKKFIKTITLLGTIMFISNCTNSITSSNNQVNLTSTESSLKVLKTISVGKTPHGMGQCQGFIYNSNIGDKTISIIDSKTDEVVKTITLLNDGVPGYAKAFHDDKNILVTDTKNGDLLVIDPLQEHKIIQTISVGKSPDKIRISEDDKTVYISLARENKVVSFTFEDDRTKTPIKKEFKVGNMTEKSEHRDLDILDDFLITTNIGDNDVSLVNISTGVEKKLKDGNEPNVVNLAKIDNKTSVAIVGNKASNTVTIFDINSDNKTVLSDVGLSPSESVVIDSLNTIFITMSGSNELIAIDYKTKKIIDKIKTKSRPVHVYSVKKKDGSHELWVGNDAGASVTVINPKTLKVIADIETGKGHHKMAFTNTKSYVSNITDNTITVINRGE